MGIPSSLADDAESLALAASDRGLLIAPAQRSEWLPASEWQQLTMLLEAVCRVVPVSAASCILVLPGVRGSVGCSLAERGGGAFRTDSSLDSRWPQPSGSTFDVAAHVTAPAYLASEPSAAPTATLTAGHHALLRSSDQRSWSSALRLYREAGLHAPFTPAERELLETLVPFLVAALGAQAGAVGARCDVAVSRALGAGQGLHLLLDRGTGRLARVSNSERDHAWLAELNPFEPALVECVEQTLSAAVEPSWPLQPLRFTLGHITAVAPVRGQTPLGESCASARLQPCVRERGGRFSSRERTVAQLLVQGYASANIAAHLAISESTVRTYIRRIYRKVGACSRAELVQKLLLSADASWRVLEDVR